MERVAGLGGVDNDDDSLGSDRWGGRSHRRGVEVESPDADVDRYSSAPHSTPGHFDRAQKERVGDIVPGFCLLHCWSARL